ncbi:winged helix-turn-helix domain-containing protein [Enterococcus sp. DIV0800]|uniref:winged helix-turn-helix domain-containing protein n=1 Tax=unclassified Enterococcus TaxID=2608891 RepID=UPI003D2F9C11
MIKNGGQAIVRLLDLFFIGDEIMKILYVTNNRQQDDKFRNYIDKLELDIFILAKHQEDLTEKTTIEFLSQIFSIIIFDETISNTFLAIVLRKIIYQFDTIIRITTISSSIENKRKWNELGVHFLFDSSTNMEEFRESIFRLQSSNDINKKIDDVKLCNFTNKERYVYKYLLENYQQMVSREKLCLEMFNEVTQSRLSALSSCINSIRKKLISQGFDYIVLKTFWGKGYQLNFDNCIDESDY